MNTHLLGKVCLHGLTVDVDKLLAKKNKLFGISIILVGDTAQLPPVGDKPLFFHSMPKTDKQVQGLLMYHQFKTAVSLTENQRVKGNNAEQTNFRELLTRARNGDSTESD